jgi:Myb-like DNA-binding domain
MKAIEVHGPEWVKVAQAVPGRTYAQCRGRYTGYLSGGTGCKTSTKDTSSRTTRAKAKRAQTVLNQRVSPSPETTSKSTSNPQSTPRASKRRKEG